MSINSSNTRSRGLTRVNAERTIHKTTANLDARSVVALEWVQHWVQRHASTKVPAPVVIRQALLVLAERISNLPAGEFGAESRRFRDAARGHGSAVSLTEARARLERHTETYRGPQAPGPQPMSHWLDMLHSVEERRASRQMLERLEQLMGDEPTSEGPAL